MKTFKLNTYFAAIPKDGSFLKEDYENANTPEELLDLAHFWFNKIENEKSQVKKAWYSSAAHYLYSFLTGEPHDSKKLLMDIENL